MNKDKSKIFEENISISNTLTLLNDNSISSKVEITSKKIKTLKIIFLL